MLIERLATLSPDISGRIAPVDFEDTMSLFIEHGMVIGAKFGMATGYEALIEWLGAKFDRLKINKSAPLERNIQWSNYGLYQAYSQAETRRTMREERLKTLVQPIVQKLSLVQHGVPVLSTPSLAPNEFWQHIQIGYHLETWMTEEVFLLAGAPKLAVIEFDTHFVCLNDTVGWVVAMTNDPQKTKRFYKERI